MNSDSQTAKPKSTPSGSQTPEPRQVVGPAVCGWDIGGANLKRALVSADGRLLEVLTEPCELWRGTGQLEAAVRRLPRLPATVPVEHAVTMSGELVDAFPDRAAGVRAILETMHRVTGAQGLAVFMMPGAWWLSTRGGAMVSSVQAREMASANWLATALLIERRFGGKVLLADLGSTTFDLVDTAAVGRGEGGADDFARLVSGELCYLGAVRTPLFHLLPSLSFRGQTLPLVPELFADIGDALIVNGSLDADVVPQAALDGRPRDRAHARRRLARCVGLDASAAPGGLIESLASRAELALLDRLTAAIDRRMVAMTESSDEKPTILGCGVGVGLVRAVANAANYGFQDLCGALAQVTPDPAVARAAQEAAPASAVALLRAEALGLLGAP